MARTLNMQFIRYLNLFEKTTNVRTEHCFSYNNGIIFVVPREKISKSIGERGKNVKKLSEILGRKIKMIASPLGKWDIERFILAIIHPVKCKSIQIEVDKVIINAGMQSKAAIIGRNKTRLNEMKNILDEYFGIKEVRII